MHQVFFYKNKLDGQILKLDGNCIDSVSTWNILFVDTDKGLSVNPYLFLTLVTVYVSTRILVRDLMADSFVCTCVHMVNCPSIHLSNMSFCQIKASPTNPGSVEAQLQEIC